MNAIGTKWNSTQGMREVMERLEDGRLAVSTEGSPYQALLAPDALARTIAVDENWYAHAQRAAAEADAEEKAEAELRARIIDGFAAGRTPLAAGKILATLKKERNAGGKVQPIYAHVEERVANGARVIVEGGERRLALPCGTYLLQRGITKAGMDYAEYLTK